MLACYISIFYLFSRRVAFSLLPPVPHYTCVESKDPILFTFACTAGHSSVFCVSICWIRLACFAINPNLGPTCLHITSFYLLYFIPNVTVFKVVERAESFGLCYAFSFFFVGRCLPLTYLHCF